MPSIVNSVATIVAINSATVAANNVGGGCCQPSPLLTFLLMLFGIAGLVVLVTGIILAVSLVFELRKVEIDVNDLMAAIVSLLLIGLGVGVIWLACDLLFFHAGCAA